jgi:hypothetical protein
MRNGIIVLLLLAAGCGQRGQWSTVCSQASPDGKTVAEVRCHTLGSLEPRHHYYLRFIPEQTFRPLSGDVTVKTSASAVKNDRVVDEWNMEHYVGYLQSMDSVEARCPSSVRWEEDGSVTLLSKKGIAGRYELKE